MTDPNAATEVHLPDYETWDWFFVTLLIDVGGAVGIVQNTLSSPPLGPDEPPQTDEEMAQVVVTGFANQFLRTNPDVPILGGYAVRLSEKLIIRPRDGQAPAETFVTGLSKSELN